MPMNKKQFESIFKEAWLPVLKEKHPNDKTAWRTVWNDEVDSAQKNGQITERQAQTWCHPNFLK